MSCTRHRRFLALIGLTVGFALVLTSCFGEDEEPEDTTTTTQGAAPTTQGATAEPPTTTQPIVVEPPTTTVVTPLIYTVQQGDTLFSIARQFGVSVDELIELNNIDNPDVIYVDDTLTIPPPSG